MYRVAAVLIAVALLCSAQALAQQLGPNGGLLGAPAGGHQAELILNPTEVVVYILEKGKLHDTKGVSLRAVIQQSGKTSTVNLVDQGGKRLVGKLDTPVEKGAIVVVSGKDHHGDPIRARYVIK